MCCQIQLTFDSGGSTGAVLFMIIIESRELWIGVLAGTCGARANAGDVLSCSSVSVLFSWDQMTDLLLGLLRPSSSSPGSTRRGAKENPADL